MSRTVPIKITSVGPILAHGLGSGLATVTQEQAETPPEVVSPKSSASRNRVCMVHILSPMHAKEGMRTRPALMSFNPEIQVHRKLPVAEMSFCIASVSNPCTDIPEGVRDIFGRGASMPSCQTICPNQILCSSRLHTQGFGWH